jgi:hypothetical protein
MEIRWYDMVGSRKVEKKQKPVYVPLFTEKYPLEEKLCECKVEQEVILTDLLSFQSGVAVPVRQL